MDTISQNIRGRIPPLPVLIPLIALVLPGCGPDHHLAEYDFREGTLAVVGPAQPQPEVFSDLDLRIDTNDPLGTVLRVGSGIAREVSLDGFRARMDTAAQMVDLPGRMVNRTMGDVGRYLRTRPADPGSLPDFEVELRIDTYGFVADRWNSGAHLSLDGDMLLLDGHTGRIIWRTRVRATDPLRTTSVRTGNGSAGNVVTAIALSRMSTEEIAAALEELADFSVDVLTNELLEDLDEARDL